MPPATVNLTIRAAYELASDVLVRNGMSALHADAVARSVVAGQHDECHSHGLYRLLVCVKGLRSGKVSGNAMPALLDVAPSIVRVDARSAFSQVAFNQATPVLVLKARESGMAALSINNCYHFSALWQEVEALAEQGVAAIAMTPSHAYVAPAGGKQPLFGTNPFAFAWPRPGKAPFVFDFATSVAARGEVELALRNQQPLPDGWAIDRNGDPTNDPHEALQGAMLPFGSYKGSALSAMIELLAGPLLGDLMSFESLEHDGGARITPFHGELIIAFSPERFSGAALEANRARAEVLLQRIVGQGARLPSQRRFAARARSFREGVHLDEALYKEICAL
ncbi:Ldh family oxidoreductase [Caballeronia sp. BR00000012568055]|uniref:Ldh family oxidoreductase n=1 Tax=Caballeronia sp. BR00000012568055 TaxID=2918761 RepID=UPI0023F885A7|nr:Ldh family oxidoreductase [Caballeronia sp. BR00000012568055]